MVYLTTTNLPTFWKMHTDQAAAAAAAAAAEERFGLIIPRDLGQECAPRFWGIASWKTIIGKEQKIRRSSKSPLKRSTKSKLTTYLVHSCLTAEAGFLNFPKLYKVCWLQKTMYYYYWTPRSALWRKASRPDTLQCRAQQFISMEILVLVWSPESSKATIVQ